MAKSTKSGYGKVQTNDTPAKTSKPVKLPAKGGKGGKSSMGSKC